MTDKLKKEQTPLEIRRKVLRLETAINLKKENLGPDPFPLKHTFVPGIYAREISAPAGMLIVTKLHKTEHFVFMLKGDVSILSEEGVKRVKAPCMMVSPVGAKRAVYTHEDTVWINIHANPEDVTDLVKLESNIIAKDYKELGLADPIKDVLELKEALCLG